MKSTTLFVVDRTIKIACFPFKYWPLSKVVDLVFGPYEEFTYESRTSPPTNTTENGPKSLS